MNGEALWNETIKALSVSGEELRTKTGLWFTASSIEGRLYVDQAAYHIPSSKLSMQRSISKRDFLLVFSYYDRWVNGEVGVRQDACSKSRNTAYIFSLIENMLHRDTRIALRPTSA